jgi:protein-S-isoprenylcysteine O-methyltransferase Ste14
MACLMDGTGAITDWNVGATALVGCSADEMLGRSLALWLECALCGACRSTRAPRSCLARERPPPHRRERIHQAMTNPRTIMWCVLIITSVCIGLALFLSAGTADYWQAWVFLGVSAVPSVLLTLYIAEDPRLLTNRTTMGPSAEQRPIQKIIVGCTGIPAIASFIVPGLDRRFGWSSVPPWLSIVGDIVVVISLWMVYLVFKENSFGSSTVEIVTDQKVIATGPYAIVRNPMYASAAVYFMGMALALGSFWGLIPAVLTSLGLVWRMFDEEEFLATNLPGYKEYCARVRWHLIPGIF